MDENFQKFFPEPIASVRNLNHKGNNQLFEVKTYKGNYLLKRYSTKQTDCWNRGGTEFIALQYLQGQGITNIPVPIRYYSEESMGIYSYETGRIIEPSQVKKEDILAAVDFLSRVHALENKNFFDPARSACLSFQDYIEVIDARLRDISQFEPQSQVERIARGFIDSRVIPEVRRIKQEFYRQVTRENASFVLPIEQQVLTPADFGFHNILVNPGYVFLDFEYFGRDDPARQVLDFVHHGKSRLIRKDLRKDFVDFYLQKTGSTDNFRDKLRVLDPLIGMTWVLIDLNPFSRKYLEHLRFAHGDIGNVVESRLEDAVKKLDDLKFFD